MTLLLICALGVAVAAGGLVVLVTLRARSAVEQRLEKLAGGLGYTTELASHLDAGEVVERTLDATMALPGVDAALVVLDQDEDGRARGVGIADEEIERVLLQMPTNANLQAMEVSFRYRLDEAASTSANLPRTAVVVALRARGETVGSLVAISRTRATAFSDATVDALDALARRAGPALGNARLFAEARELADLDSLTGLHNRRCFHEFLQREIARARRYDRSLALIVMDIDDFKRINDRIGHLGGDHVLAEVANRMQAAVRSTDIACRVGGDEFAIVLPESNRGDAELLAGRISRAIAAQQIEKAGSLNLSAGVAELNDDDTPDGFFERADDALYRAKDSGKARTVAS